jgi:hypothetical protein
MLVSSLEFDGGRKDTTAAFGRESMRRNTHFSTKTDGLAGSNSMTDQSIPQPPAEPPASQQEAPAKPKEIGGPKGPEPTRYGDWERKGRCIDF